MTSGLELTPDLLATHGRALRGLARSLLHDGDAAEDVVQETWLACLRYPGTVPVRLSSWLGTVASRLALRRKRGDTRRRVREERAATPERLEALQQRALEREEALRAVTTALLALEEPFKTALFLRFYEERTPSEIAAELDLPVTTVKSRITRGLERLRMRLGSELGDEARLARALVILAGAPARAPIPASPAAAPSGAALAPTTLGTATLGTMGAGLPLKLALGCAILASGAALWWQQPRGEQAHAAGTEPALARATQADVGEPSVREGDSPVAAATTGGEEARREALAPRDDAPAAVEAFPPEQSFVYRVSGIVRDELGLPLAGARVFLAPHLFPLNRAARTDDKGRFALEFEGRRATLACAFAVDGPGARALGLRQLQLVAGRELALDVALGAGRQSTVEVETLSPGSFTLALGEKAAQGARIEQRGSLEETIEEKKLEGAPLVAQYSVDGLDSEETRWMASTLALRLSGSIRSDGPFDGAPEMLRRADGRGVFVDPPPTQVCPRADEPVRSEIAEIDLGRLTPPARVRSRAVLETVFDRLDATRTLELTLPDVTASGLLQQETPVPAASVRGIVRDERGEPVPNATVGWGPPGEAFAGSTSSDEHGAFELTQLPPGALFLRAGDSELGLARLASTLALGQELAWNPVLERRDEVSGRVVRANGDALTGMRVELWSTGATNVWCASTFTRADGRFSFLEVPLGALELHVYATGPVDPPSVFPVRVLAPVYARSDVGAIALDAKDLVTHTLSAELLDAGGTPLFGAELRAWQASTGRGLYAAPGEGGKLVLAGLPAGAYRIEAGGPLGWRDLGEVWLEDDLALAPERFDAPGTLALATSEAAAQGGIATSLWSAHPDVFGHVAAREPLGELVVLRPGAYVACAVAKHGGRAEAPFTVRGKDVCALELGTDPKGSPRFEERAGLDLATQTHATTAAWLVAQSCSACHAH